MHKCNNVTTLSIEDLVIIDMQHTIKRNDHKTMHR